MSVLSAFLHPVTTTEEKEVVISKRFVDDKGNPVPFKIKAITQEENDALVRAATRVEEKNGRRVEYLDSVDFARRLVVASTVSPDFTSKEMCDTYGVVSPQLVPGKMLLSGEYNRLMEAITDLSGLAENLESEVKN
jgi:hypothetical protein